MRERARSAVDQQKDAAAGSIEGVARALRSASDDLEHRGQPMVAEYSRQVAAGLESMANWVSRRNLDDLVGGIEDFARPTRGLHERGHGRGLRAGPLHEELVGPPLAGGRERLRPGVPPGHAAAKRVRRRVHRQLGLIRAGEAGATRAWRSTASPGSRGQGMPTPPAGTSTPPASGGTTPTGSPSRPTEGGI